MDTSLAFGPDGNPAISYHYGSGRDLKYTRWNGAAWDTETVDSAGDIGARTSLAFDASGNPAISYEDRGNHDLKYANWDGSCWEIETVDGAGDVGDYTSLASMPVVTLRSAIVTRETGT